MPVGRTNTNASMNASSIGPCRPWAFRSALAGSSPVFHAPPVLTRPALRDLSRVTAGKVRRSPSIVSTGLAPAANGARPGSNQMCIAVTPDVVTRIVSPSIFASTRARVQCSATASTVSQNILL